MNFICGLFLVGCLFLPNIKSYFLWSILFVLAIFLVSKSWEKVVIFGYWPLSVYYVGQLYIFQVIRTEELYLPLYPDGRSLYFKFTPLLIFGMSMIVAWVMKVVKYGCKTNWLIVILLVTVLTRLVSTFLNGGILPWWQGIGMMINNLSLIIWLWWMTDYLNKVKLKEREYFWKYLARILKISIIVGSVIVILQVLKGSVLGLVVEQRTDLPYFGIEITEIRRMVGIWNHPNEAAFYIFMWLVAWLHLRVKAKVVINKILTWWLLIPLVALILLQSRSVFMGMGLMMLWATIFYWRELNLKRWLKTKIIQINLWYLVVVLMLVFGIGRMLLFSVVNSGVGDDWNSRQKLVQVARQLIKNHFWWGVGDNNFIPMAFREDVLGIIKNFPESVHQGWLLILSEEGIFGFSIWLIFIIILSKMWWTKTRNNFKLRWLGIFSLLSQTVIMMFQPFSNILMSNLIIAVLLLANEDEKYI